MKRGLFRRTSFCRSLFADAVAIHGFSSRGLSLAALVCASREKLAAGPRPCVSISYGEYLSAKSRTRLDGDRVCKARRRADALNARAVLRRGGAEGAGHGATR